MFPISVTGDATPETANQLASGKSGTSSCFWLQLGLFTRTGTTSSDTSSSNSLESELLTVFCLVVHFQFPRSVGSVSSNCSLPGVVIVALIRRLRFLFKSEFSSSGSRSQEELKDAETAPRTQAADTFESNLVYVWHLWLSSSRCYQSSWPQTRSQMLTRRPYVCWVSYVSQTL